jgi:thioredoxin 1
MRRSMDQVRGLAPRKKRRRALLAVAETVLVLAVLMAAASCSEPSGTRAQSASSAPTGTVPQAASLEPAPSSQTAVGVSTANAAAAATATTTPAAVVAPAGETAGQLEVSATSTAAAPKASLPRLVDLGAGKCIPCKMMAPILEELSETHKAFFEVEFIDVWVDRSMGAKYGVRAIPTQIFYDTAGKELYRHVGFYSREQILSKWRALGVDVGE